MKIEEKIMRILDDYKESFMDGSDGEYYRYFAIHDEDFGDLTKELLKILKEK